MNANTAIRTPMLFGSVEANVYSWKGLTERENYEEYLIHIYSKNYFKICEEHNNDLIMKRAYENEIDNLLQNGKHSKKRMERIKQLEYSIGLVERRTMEDRCCYINIERCVNKHISEEKNYNEKTKAFDLPDKIRDTQKDNAEYHLNYFIKHHIREAKHRMKNKQYITE